jgi:hypothetical protein
MLPRSVGMAATGGGANVCVFRRICASVGVVAAVMLVVNVLPANAATTRSGDVAIVLGGGSEDVGALQTAGTVAGAPEDDFDEFAFTDLTPESLEPGSLSGFDTVVLDQVFTSELSEAQKQLLSSFVTSGGKLIIHDADGTEGNDYSWLPVPTATGESCENCGNTNGEAEVIENNTLVSNEPSSPYYIDVDEFPVNSDAIGDANLLLTEDPRWDKNIVAKNGLEVEGIADAYASDGGLIIYNGFDLDAIDAAFPSGVDWLDKMWHQELAQQWDPDNLPHSNPASSGSNGPVVRCGREALKVGVVSVCATKITGSGADAEATGNVVLDAGVSVGNGPIKIDEQAKQISSETAASIQLLRSSGGPISLGSTAFTIEASGTTDPVSGKSGLAKVLLTSANLAPLANLRAGGLPFSLPLDGSLTMYLDSEQDGGLIGAGSIQLPMLGKLQTSGALSLGFYANSPSPVVVLGGGAKFGAVDFGDGWKFEGLELNYQQPSNTWTASGGLAVPVGSLHASGSVVNGALNSLQVSIGGQNVPLGDSGFFFSGFGGGFSGLANGPLKIDATTEGYWGVPKAPVEPFYLDNVTVTLSLGGSIELDGAVSFVFKDHSPLQGALHLKLGISPFTAIGTASMQGSIPGLSLHAGGGAGFTSKHFTAAENGSIDVMGLSGSGQVIASDKGLGVSGRLCAPAHIYCQSMALAGTWSQIEKFDVPSIIGGEPKHLITVSGVAAAGQSARIAVPAGRSVLFAIVHDPTGSPEILVRSPGGRTYRSSHSSRTVIFTHQPQFGLTTVAIVRPQHGIWRISPAQAQTGELHVDAETVRPVKLVRVGSISPASSKRRPLRSGRLLISWHSSRLPAGVRLTIVRRTKSDEAGVGVAGNLPASGRYALPVGKLARGRNFLSLSAALNGVPFQTINIRQPIWRATATSRKGATRDRHRKRT